MACCCSQSTIFVPTLTGPGAWDEWFECIKLLATLTGSWEFLDPTLPDNDVRKIGNTSQKVSGDGKAKAISGPYAEYDPAMKGLREVTAAIFNSLNWENKEVLKEVNGKLHVNGIHIGRQMLVILAKKIKPELLEQATARQNQAAQESQQ